MMRRVALTVTAAAALAVGVLAAPSPAGADGTGGANNVVLANNTVDNTAVARDRVQVARDAADTAANQNLAIARSTDCVGCRTVAVAMQVVLVQGSPSDFQPANAASAVNAGCTGCQTYAFAYQDVIQTDQIVYLSSSTYDQLASLRQRVDAVARDTSLSPDVMKSDLDSLFARVEQAVNDGVQATGATAHTWATQSSQTA